MSQIKIAVIVGSIRKDSFNRKLATALARLAPADFQFEQVPIDALPLYNQDHDGSPSAEVTRFKDAIKSAIAGGEHVPGVIMSNGSVSLQIRRV